MSNILLYLSYYVSIIYVSVANVLLYLSYYVSNIFSGYRKCFVLFELLCLEYF